MPESACLGARIEASVALCRCVELVQKFQATLHVARRGKCAESRFAIKLCQRSRECSERARLARGRPLHRRGPADGGCPARDRGPLVRQPSGDRSLRHASNQPSRIQKSLRRSDGTFRDGRRETGIKRNPGGPTSVPVDCFAFATATQRLNLCGRDE